MLLENSACDNCLIGFMVFMQMLACICDLAACLTQNEELGHCVRMRSFPAPNLPCFSAGPLASPPAGLAFPRGRKACFSSRSLSTRPSSEPQTTLCAGALRGHVRQLCVLLGVRVHANAAQGASTFFFLRVLEGMRVPADLSNMHV